VISLGDGGYLAKVFGGVLIASVVGGPALLISWAVQCVINARGSSFNDSPSAWLRIRPPLLPAISHAVTLLALVLLTQPRHEHMLAAQALLVLRSVVGVVAIMPNFLAARWSAYEEAASHVWLCSVFVILIWTFPPSGDVRARQRVSPLWWCARTMPAAAACSAAAVGVCLHMCTGGTATSFPPAPLAGMVLPTLSSSILEFSLPVVLVVAAFNPHNRLFMYRWCHRAVRTIVHTTGRGGHAATRLHVDSICAGCSDLLATCVLKPCGLGVCDGCFAAIVPRRTRRLDKTIAGARSCPRCTERISHWVRIRHLDLHDDKAV